MNHKRGTTKRRAGLLVAVMAVSLMWGVPGAHAQTRLPPVHPPATDWRNSVSPLPAVNPYSFPQGESNNLLLASGGYPGQPPAPPYELTYPPPLQTSGPTTTYLPAEPTFYSPGEMTGVSRGRWLGGADLLLVRPTFSEAIAYAQGTQVFPVSMNTQAVPIEFDYDAGLRAFAGYQFSDSGASLLFTFTNISAESAATGTVGAPGEFIVDPFGNLVGTVQVIDPSDARGLGTVLQQGPFVGDRIRTLTTVNLQVYDLTYSAPLQFGPPCFSWNYKAGLRMADVGQSYVSQVEAGGLTIAQGSYRVDYFGVGPLVGIQGARHFGTQGRLSAFASLSGSLVVGTYDVSFANSPLPGLNYAQGESALRTIPVMESELGLKWRAFDSLQLSAGWLFQSWWDLGASGGTFGGLFSGADDANIMAFDGLFLRGEFAY